MAKFCYPRQQQGMTAAVSPQNWYSLCSEVWYDTDDLLCHKGCLQENKTLPQVESYQWLNFTPQNEGKVGLYFAACWAN